MLDFFVNPYLMPFHICVLALIVLSIVETLGIYLGMRPSRLLNRCLPKALNQSPLLNVKFSKILIIVFLLINFSFAGYFLQLGFFASQHFFISPYYMMLPASVMAIFFTVFMIHCLDQVIKPNTLQANSSLVGRLATICAGNARPGLSAQARVRDEWGQLYYVQVEPEFGELELNSQVILIQMHKHHYVAKKIAHSNYLFLPD